MVTCGYNGLHMFAVYNIWLRWVTHGYIYLLGYTWLYCVTHGCTGLHMVTVGNI